MLKLSLLTVICIANSGSAFAVQGPSWSPDLATVQKLDAEIAKSPNFDGFSCPSPDVAEFSRYYWGASDSAGHRVLAGQFLRVKDFPGEKAGVHLQRGPGIADGGCSVANLYYDVEGSKPAKVSWGGR